MGNTIKKTGQYVKDIEYKAGMEYNAVKIQEDSYIIPTNIVNTNLIESQDFKNSDFYKNEELKKLIYKMDVAEGDYISVSCSGMTEDGKIIIDILNVKDPSRVYHIALESQFDHEDREMLVMMIADSHKEVKDVHISFYVGCDFEALEQLFEEEQ